MDSGRLTAYPDSISIFDHHFSAVQEAADDGHGTYHS